MHPYRIFISHAWRFGEHYERLVQILDRYPGFEYENFSAPKDEPVTSGYSPDSTAIIHLGIRSKILIANCVVLLSDIYLSHTEWMTVELNAAQLIERPIVGIRPWPDGQMPSKLADYCVEVVGWKPDDIVEAIRRHAALESDG